MDVEEIPAKLRKRLPQVPDGAGPWVLLLPTVGLPRWLWWASELTYSVSCVAEGRKAVRLSYRRWKSMGGVASFTIEQQNLRAVWGPAHVTLIDVEPATALVYRVAHWAFARHPGMVWRVR